jgi:hypothetical protein
MGTCNFITGGKRMSRIIRHAFLTPSHNCWSLWNADGCENITNEKSNSHRVLETLTYAIDRMASEGWHVQEIFVEQGLPNLVLLVREENVMD